MFWIATRVSLLGMVVLVACENNNSGGYFSSVEQPTTINLYPSQDANRLYVLVTAVGTQTLTLPLAFDTGSAGITLNALAVFPSSVVTSAGFNFPAGQDLITFDGITVTKLNGTRLYGGSNGTTEHGNLGFAQVSFGDSAGSLRTAMMPVFFYYSITESATGKPQAPLHKQGFFGVNSAADKIYAANPVEGAPNHLPCSMASEADCYVISILKYLGYVSPLHAGLMLMPSPLQPCDIAVGNCMPAPILNIGLTDSMESEFSQVTLTCPQESYSGPSEIDGYAVCQAQIPFTEVTVSIPGKGGTTKISLIENVLFDSGNQANDVEDNSGTVQSPLPDNASIGVEPPSGFIYTYMVTSSSTTTTNVGNVSTGFGINYFTNNSFYIDFTTNTEGWMSHQQAH